MSSDAMEAMEREDDNETASHRSTNQNRGDRDVAEEERCTASADRPLLCSSVFSREESDRISAAGVGIIVASDHSSVEPSPSCRRELFSDVAVQPPSQELAPTSAACREQWVAGRRRNPEEAGGGSEIGLSASETGGVLAVNGVTLHSVASSHTSAGSSRGHAKSLQALESSVASAAIRKAHEPTDRSESSASPSSSGCPPWVSEKQNLAQSQQLLLRRAASSLQGSVHTEEEQEWPPPPSSRAASPVWVSEKGNLAHSQSLLQARRTMSSRSGMGSCQRASSEGRTIFEEKEEEGARLTAAASPFLFGWVSEKQNLPRSQRVKQPRADSDVVPPVNRSISFDDGEEMPRRSAGAGASSDDNTTQAEEAAEEYAEPSGGSEAGDAAGTIALNPPMLVTPPAPTGAQPNSQPCYSLQQPTTVDDVSPGAVYIRSHGAVRFPAAARRVRPLRRMSSILGSISSASNWGRDVVVEVTAQLAPGEEAAAVEGRGPLRSGTASPTRRGGSLVLEGVPVPSQVGGEGQRRARDGGTEGGSACSPSRHHANLIWTVVAVVLLAAAIAIAAVLLGTRLESSPKTSEHSVPEPGQEADPILEIVSQLSSMKALNDTQSPQHWAFRWLVEEGGPFSAAALKDDPPRLLQRYALAVLYYSTGGPHWRYQLNFLSSNHECDWFDKITNIGRRGVTFCNNNSQVLSIRMSSNNITGALPGAELTAFPFLKTLRMPFNQLESTIPSELSSLKSLQRIQLNGNALRGPLMENIGDLQDLLHLDLGKNKLNSTIPLSIGYLKALKRLDLNENMFSGEIPSRIGSMSNLEYLNLGFNYLSSTVPPSWNALAKLERLYITGNDLNGTLPVIPSGNQNLTHLVAGENHFTGTIPTSLGALPRLTVVLLENNELHGTIPELLSGLMELEVLSFGSNNLTGEMPADIVRSGTLRVFGVGYNGLTGSLPNDIGNPREILVLSAEQNLLTGTIPWTYGNLPALNALALHSNLLSGTIPWTLGNNTEILGLMLENNMLNGTVPKSLAKLKNALWMSLARNDLTGDLSFVCAPEVSSSQIVTADCAQPSIEVSCDCCICCNDAEGGCDLSVDLVAYIKGCLNDGSCDFWGGWERS